MHPTSLTKLSCLRFAAALALLAAAGCNNFKKGTPQDGGVDAPGQDAGGGNGGQAGGGGSAGGNGGHADGGGAGGNAGGGGAGGNGAGGNGGHGGAGGESNHDAGTDAGTPIPTNGLVAYYPFNGNTNDESGNGHTATADLGAFDTDRFGLANKAYNLIPNNDNDWYGIVSAPTLPLTSDMTIAVWTKVSPNNNNERIAGVGDSWIGLQFAGQQVTFGNGGAQPAIVTDPNPITKNTWTFLVGTVSSNADGDFISLYRDGNLVTSKMFTDYYLEGSPGNCRFYMGNTLTGGTTQNCTGSSQAFEYPGDVDDVRVYNRALSLAEVQALYHEQP